MTDRVYRTLAAGTGLVLALLLGVWWLGSVRHALAVGDDPQRVSMALLAMAWLGRACLVPLWALPAGHHRGGPAASLEALTLLSPSWPLVLLAWSAGAGTALGVCLAELMLIGLALSAPWLGRALRARPFAEPLTQGAGVVLAAVVGWFGPPGF